MMTTIDLPEDPLEEARARAAHRQAARQTAIELPTCGTGGTAPGVRIDDNATVRDLMDGID
jgi:hypothetical protein